jgi:hypothetical protein
MSRTRNLLIIIYILVVVQAHGQGKVSTAEVQQVNKPTCVSIDLLYEKPKNGVLTLAGPPTNQDVALLVMQRAGEIYWEEVTHKGKKLPGICIDKNHPYYIMTWTDIPSTVVFKRSVPTSETQTTISGHVGDDAIHATENSVTWQTMDVPVTDHSATISIYVVDYEEGCIVFPPVFGTYRINHDSEKATKKAMEEALQFLIRTGIQAAPKPIICFKPETIGISADYVSQK